MAKNFIFSVRSSMDKPAAVLSKTTSLDEFEYPVFHGSPSVTTMSIEDPRLLIAWCQCV